MTLLDSAMREEKTVAGMISAQPIGPHPRLHPRLDPVTWRTQLLALAELCAHCPATEQAERLDDARRLLAAAAPLDIARVGPLPERVRFAELLALEAWESAALSLIGRETGYMLSRGSTGLHLVTIVLADAYDEQTAQGETAALALLAGYLQALAGA